MRMAWNFNLTDYKIQSRKIYWGTIISINAIVIAFLLLELFLDLRSTSLQVIIPFAILIAVNSGLAYKYPRTAFFKFSIITIACCLLESLLLAKPYIFHTVIFWYTFIPLIALVIQGLKASQFWLLVTILAQVFNFFYVKSVLGESYTYPISLVPSLITGAIYISGILAFSYLLYALLGDAFFKMKQKNAELVQLKAEIEDKKNNLEKYQQQLIDLSRNSSVYKSGLNDLLRSICFTVSRTLGAGRVGVWHFEESNNKLVRKLLFEQESTTDEPEELSRADFPGFFKAIMTEPFIMVNDLANEPEIRPFLMVQPGKINIKSILLCPVMLDGKPIGVISCANHETREWQTEDALFVQSIADFIALSYKNERIKNLITQVRHQNYELIERSDEIQTMNEELSALNEELKTMNETLEETVKERTSELEMQNQQLTEYAFINSHLLRAPLSRILGLSNLISRETTSVQDTKLVTALLNSANELDTIVRKISDILYDGNHLSREEINSIIDRTLHNN